MYANALDERLMRNQNIHMMPTYQKGNIPLQEILALLILALILMLCAS